MISLTLREWNTYKEEWAKRHDVGTRVIVYSRPIVYNKKRSAVAVYGKFELNEAREWVRL